MTLMLRLSSRFPVLDLISKLMWLAAWVSLLGGAFLATRVLVGGEAGLIVLSARTAALVSAAGGLTCFLLFACVAELIQLMMSIELNAWRLLSSQDDLLEMLAAGPGAARGGAPP